jgi:cell division septation protein DedD
MATAPRRYKSATRRKKTSRRKTTTRKTASGGSRKLPNWSLLVLGLAIGLLLAWLIQLVIYGMRNPKSGLNHLMTSSTPASSRTRVNKNTGAKNSDAKPSYDFYTILPETETPLTDREWVRQKHAPVEKGVSYMLQAASYSTYKDADQLKAKLILNGLSSSIQKVSIENKGTYYRVRVGPFASTKQVDQARETLATLGIKPLLLKIANQEN